MRRKFAWAWLTYCLLWAVMWAIAPFYGLARAGEWLGFLPSVGAVILFWGYGAWICHNLAKPALRELEKGQ